MSKTLPVPDSEKTVLANLLRDLERTYPDKKIFRLGKDHNEWDKKVTRLYKSIGYASRDEFLEAYGYTLVRGGGGRPSTVDPKHVVEELSKRYSGDHYADSMDQIKQENPDLASSIKSLENQSRNLFGMTLKKYLTTKGVFKGSSLTDAEKIDAIVKELKKRYADKPKATTLAECIEKNPDIPDIKNIHTLIRRVYDQKSLEFFVNEGLVANPELFGGNDLLNLSSKEKLDIITEELKARYVGKTLSDSVDQIYNDNPDLPNRYQMRKYIAEVYGNGKTLSEYFVEIGLIAAKLSDEELLEQMMSVLKDRYVTKATKIAKSISDLSSQNPDLPIYRLSGLIKSVYGQPVLECLVKEKIISGFSLDKLIRDRLEKERIKKEREDNKAAAQLAIIKNEGIMKKMTCTDCGRSNIVYLYER